MLPFGPHKEAKVTKLGQKIALREVFLPEIGVGAQVSMGENMRSLFSPCKT